MKFNFFRPLDAFLLLAVIAAAAWSLFSSPGSIGAHAEVYVGSRKAARFDLTGPENIKKISTEIGELNVRCGSGRIWVAHSPCPQKICVKQGPISETHERIYCLPARVLIRITGQDESVKPEDAIDAVIP